MDWDGVRFEVLELFSHLSKHSKFFEPLAIRAMDSRDKELRAHAMLLLFKHVSREQARKRALSAIRSADREIRFAGIAFFSLGLGVPGDLKLLQGLRGGEQDKVCKEELALAITRLTKSKAPAKKGNDSIPQPEETDMMSVDRFAEQGGLE